jgi:hypothetical protein
MDLKEEHLLGDEVKTHWYYRAKLEALMRAIRDIDVATIVDVGAGSGFFSRALLEKTSARRAICVDPGYLADKDELIGDKQLSFRRSIDEIDAGLVLMMDVIEHVEDDRGLVREYADKVAAGTQFVVTVPAFMWLWSGHDVFLEHYRRYTLGQLESVLETSGLHVEHGHYFYGAVLPLVAGVRFAKRRRADAVPESDMRRYGPATNRLLFEASRAEILLMRANRIGGTTVFAQAIKR